MRPDFVKLSQTDQARQRVDVSQHRDATQEDGCMDRFGLWSIPFVIVLAGAGELSRQILTPWLHTLHPDWPSWVGYIITPLPGLVLVGAIGYWLFRRLDPSRRGRP